MNDVVITMKIGQLTQSLIEAFHRGALEASDIEKAIALAYEGGKIDGEIQGAKDALDRIKMGEKR